MSVNKVILIGNLGKEPEITAFDAINIKASFSLATNEYYKNKEGQKIEHTEWHNIICWRKNAEFSRDYIKKGMTVYIEGKIQSRFWEDKEGNKRYITEIVADTIQLLTKRDASIQNMEEPSLKEEKSTPPSIDDILPF